MKFTFDPAKCDRIFAELLKFGYIKLSHALSSLEESKKGLIANGITLSLMGLMITMFSIGRSNRLSMRVEGRLSLTEMQADKVPFLVNVLQKGEPIVLSCPEQADTTVGKNVIIGKPQEAPKVQKVLGRKVVLEKDEDGKKQTQDHKGINKAPERATTRQGDSCPAEVGQAGSDPAHIAKLAMSVQTVLVAPISVF
jgi:hypothetical protein